MLRTTEDPLQKFRTMDYQADFNTFFSLQSMHFIIWTTLKTSAFIITLNPILLLVFTLCAACRICDEHIHRACASFGHKGLNSNILWQGEMFHLSQSPFEFTAPDVSVLMLGFGRHNFLIWRSTSPQLHPPTDQSGQNGKAEYVVSSFY